VGDAKHHAYLRRRAPHAAAAAAESEGWGGDRGKEEEEELREVVAFAASGLNIISGFGGSAQGGAAAKRPSVTSRLGRSPGAGAVTAVTAAADKTDKTEKTEGPQVTGLSI
jgi:hypothetical protein